LRKGAGALHGNVAENCRSTPVSTLCCPSCS